MFDMTLSLKTNVNHNFSGIDKKELDIIMDYFSSKKIPVKTVNENTTAFKIDEGEDESDDVKFLR